MSTQADAVLDYLRKTGPLDQFTAKDELGVLRLGARIWHLKQRGYAIRTELVEAPTEYGGSRIAQYSLIRAAVRQSTDPLTLDEAFWMFGDRAAALGAPPSLADYQRTLGVSSESVAQRWLRVLEREGYISLRAVGDRPAFQSAYVITPAGYERMYALERQRRVAAEAVAS